MDTLEQAWHALARIPHIGLYLTIGWLAYVAGLGLWIVLQKREPVATLSWLVSLAALPYLGFFIYYVFGPQRIRRQRLRRGRARVGMPPPPVGHDPSPESTELARVARATTGLPAGSATSVRLLVDGAAKYDALLAAVAQARDHIHLEYYIYKPDRIGTALRDALAERARAGVTVRLLLDAVGAARITRRFMQPLLDAGGEIAWFHPMRLHRFWKRPWLNLRTHRKIVIIDHRVAFTGGINITDEQDERACGDAYRDLHLRLEGEVVGALQLVFVEDWAYATRLPPLVLPETSGPLGPIASQVLVSGPDSPWEAIHRVHVSAIHAAARRVWLVTPYFVPGEAAMMALTSAALGGLDVRLIVPKVCDSRLVTYATRSYFDDLLQAGVRIHEYTPRLMHTKALLCDDDLAIIGSANFDHRSFRLNFEVSVLFRDETVAGELAKLLEHDLLDAPEVRNDRARPLLRSRLPEALARLVSPLL
ncbi:cardiolipin synthase [Cognatilysobacter bugurensis]|uniref:Cardiolipin synthase n=1 Tax=Cognatilysobacter bugurensis TaxID=543356 RepID=A0A918WA04_9GAMM|nr:cardiolipin synthase [Lysobacter bugurensis]GHA87063.1 cardiolipin synthase [Lysobacter bugurensis]